MVLVLYGSTTSPPVRAVRLVCRALGVEYDFKIVNVVGGDLNKPEFLKLNPQHTVPTIVDGDFVIWDSHAIVAYLADKFGTDDSWYPKDLRKRAIVNQRLHFDNAILFTRLRDVVEPIFYRNILEIPDEKAKRLQDALDLLETSVLEGGWLAGAAPTIADCCAVASVTSILAVLPDLKTPPKLAAWLQRCEDTLPGYEDINKSAAAVMVKAMAEKLGRK